MKILRALMLVLTVSVCAYAGEMPNDTPTPGNMPNGVTTTPTGAQATESVTAEVALSVMQGLLSVF